MPESTTDPSSRSYLKGCLFAVLAVIVLCVAAVVLVNIAMHQFFRAILVGKTGPVASPAEWPQPLKDLVADAARAKIEIQELQVHHMNEGFDPEYIWRMKASPGLFDFLKDRWKLSPMPPPEHGVFCGRSNFSGDPTPEWWSPINKGSAEVRFYGCKNVLAGEKGDLFRVALDEKRKIIFVQYHFNF